jgi:hypothetical protein
MTGTGTPSAVVPKEEQAGVDMVPHGDHPADGRDLGAAASMNDTARAGEAKVARDDQLKGYGEGQQRQRHPKDQPKGCGAGPQHQQQPQDQRGKRRRPPQEQPRPPPRAAQEQLGAAASTGDTARAEEAHAAPERASQELGKTQTAAQRKQERSRPRRAPRAAPGQQETATDTGDTAGAEEREEPVLSDPGQRASKMDIWKKLAALLEREGIKKSGQKSRMMAGLSQITKSMNQPAPEAESSVPAVAVGVLRAEKPKDVSQWRCKVPTVHALGAIIRW